MNYSKSNRRRENKRDAVSLWAEPNFAILQHFNSKKTSFSSRKKVANSSPAHFLGYCDTRTFFYDFITGFSFSQCLFMSLF